jgi:hypothetical protein
MRLLIVLTASVLATAAPLRAWCEANCLAPAQQADAAAPSHCSTHEPAGDGTSMSASAIDDCPIVESGRPAQAARVDLKATVTTVFAPHLAGTATPRHSTTITAHVTTVFERHTPLRI